MSSKKVAGKPGLDPTLPDVPLVLNGTTYQLCFDFNAVATVQAETEINLFAADQTQFSPVNFRAMLYASLLKAHPEITLEQTGSLITPRSIPAVADAIGKAWGESKAEDVEGTSPNV